MKYLYFSLLMLFVLMLACHEEKEVSSPSVQNLNLLTMNLNSNSWEPTILSPCQKTFQASMSWLNTKPYYNIEAYKDSKGSTSLDSENLLQIQIMNVTKAGDYVIDGSFTKTLSSYARFRVKDGNGVHIYQNKANDDSFHVVITELFPSANTTVVGFKGTYGGTLYNIDNPSDSLIITDGEFVFKKINFYDFNQCEN